MPDFNKIRAKQLHSDVSGLVVQYGSGNFALLSDFLNTGSYFDSQIESVNDEVDAVSGYAIGLSGILNNKINASGAYVISYISASGLVYSLNSLSGALILTGINGVYVSGSGNNLLVNYTGADKIFSSGSGYQAFTSSYGNSNNFVGGDYSFSVGGSGNSISGDGSMILGGIRNQIKMPSVASYSYNIIIGDDQNVITNSTENTVINNFQASISDSGNDYTYENFLANGSSNIVSNSSTSLVLCSTNASVTNPYYATDDRTYRNSVINSLGGTVTAAKDSLLLSTYSSTIRSTNSSTENTYDDLVLGGTSCLIENSNYSTVSNSLNSSVTDSTFCHISNGNSSSIIQGANYSMSFGPNSTVYGGDYCFNFGFNPFSSGDYQWARGLCGTTQSQFQESYGNAADISNIGPQSSIYRQRVTSTGSAPTEMSPTLFVSTYRTPNASKMLAFNAHLVGRKAAVSGAGIYYRLDGIVENVSGNIQLVGDVIKTLVTSGVGMSGCDVSCGINFTNKTLVFSGIGQAATSINWQNTIYTSETN